MRIKIIKLNDHKYFSASRGEIIQEWKIKPTDSFFLNMKWNLLNIVSLFMDDDNEMVFNFWRKNKQLQSKQIENDINMYD